MRSQLLVPVLAGAAAAQAGIDFDAVFSAQPALKHLKPTSSAPVDRSASASSIISRMNDVKPTVSGVSTSKSKSVTGKAKATAKATLPKLATTKKPAKKAAKKTSKKAKKGKRDAVCGPQSIQYGYTPSPNNPSGFLLDNLLATTASLINPPAGYTKSFLNQFASVNADSYVGYYQLASYSVQGCADICTQVGSACQAFNIYYERNPTVNPGDSCPNPTAATSVRCALWGSQINATQAINIGQWRALFMTVVSGSNGYWKNPAPANVTGFNASQALAGFVNPSSRTPLSTTLIAGTGYSPAACGQLCTQWNTDKSTAASNSGATTFQACNYFNAAILSANGVAVPGTYCSLFTGTDAGQYATLFTSTAASGASYDISSSYGYALTTPNNGTVTAAAGTCNALAPYAAASGGRTYELHCGYDFQYNDFAAKPAANLTACFALCDASTRCNAAAYSRGGKYCYMKDLTNTTGKPIVSSGVDFVFVSGGSYVWPGSATTTTTTSTTATSTTTTTTSPAAVSTTSTQAAASATGTAVTCASLNSTSYVYPGTSRSFDLHCGYDLAASGDLGGQHVNSFTDCVQVCNNNTSCNGAVWASGSGYCYPKSLTGSTQKATVSSSNDFFMDPRAFNFTTT